MRIFTFKTLPDFQFKSPMKNQKMYNALIFGLVFFSLTAISFAQTKPLIKRTTYKSEKIEFGAGGTVSVVGAPVGSIEIEGWNKNEVEISAEIQMQAESEADLAQLAAVNGFMIDDSANHLRIISVGAHDKRYVKQAAKNFPKNLLGTPYRIDFQIKVPAFCDLSIDGGKGDLNLSGVEGAIIVKYLESNARLKLTGGAVSATFGSGAVDVTIASQSWRGRSAEIQIANGNLNVHLPPNLNADLNASVLRAGKIENLYEFLKPRNRTKFSEKAMLAKAGSGGATLVFTVGDGNLKISENGVRQAQNSN
jgi:hypothetical protein